MNYLTIIILIFSVLGALDYILGNKFGLGKEFERAFMLLGAMALSMIGMIVISPLIASVMEPVSQFFKAMLGIDPSVIPASLFANDMGGASLATQMAADEKMGLYNGLVTSSMMGCTISFTIPFALGVVKKEQHKELLLGILCGIVTIPAGCIVAGIICKIPLHELLLTLLPLVILAAVIAFGIACFPEFCIKIFKIFGIFITSIIIAGLSLGIIRFLTGFEVIKGLATVEEGASICINAAVVLSGSFPMVYVLSKLLSKPLEGLSKITGLNSSSVVGFLSSSASSATTFGMMDKMDKKGVVLNSAFSVSGAFIVGSHLAFTMAINMSYVLPVIVGKVVSGALAVLLASIIFKRVYKEN